MLPRLMLQITPTLSAFHLCSAACPCSREQWHIAAMAHCCASLACECPRMFRCLHTAQRPAHQAQLHAAAQHFAAAAGMAHAAHLPACSSLTVRAVQAALLASLPHADMAASSLSSKASLPGLATWACMQGATPAAFARSLNTQKEFFWQVAWLLLALEHVRAWRQGITKSAADITHC